MGYLELMLWYYNDHVHLHRSVNGVNDLGFLNALFFLSLNLSSGRIPVRLYVRSIGEDIEDIEDASAMDSWDRISYINRPVEIQWEEGTRNTYWPFIYFFFSL